MEMSEARIYQKLSPAGKAIASKIEIALRSQYGQGEECEILARTNLHWRSQKDYPIVKRSLSRTMKSLCLYLC
jgi:hypothetical protein